MQSTVGSDAFSIPRGDAVSSSRDDPAAGSQASLILAGCRTSWHAPLAREASRTLGARVLAFERPADLIHKAQALAANGDPIALVIVEVVYHAPCLQFMHEQLPNVPVVAVGHGDRIEERLQASLLGASAFLSDPVSIREIVFVASRLCDTPWSCAATASHRRVPASSPCPERAQ